MGVQGRERLELLPAPGARLDGDRDAGTNSLVGVTGLRLLTGLLDQGQIVNVFIRQLVDLAGGVVKPLELSNGRAEHPRIKPMVKYAGPELTAGWDLRALLLVDK